MPQLLHDATAPTVPAADAPDDQVVVEARTAEEALAEVHRVHGDDARILRAEKVVKGGVGGFFAKELVQLTVEPADAVPAPVAPSASPMAAPAHDGPADPFADETFGDLLDRSTGTGRGLSSVVAELAAATNHRESTFGDALRTAMDEPTPAAPQQDAAAAVRARDPRLAVGATALADAAPHVDPSAVAPDTQGSGVAGTALAEVAAAATTTSDAEARLDAAVRAVQAGTTASTVVRAAEQGGVTNYAAPSLGEPEGAQPVASTAATAATPATPAAAVTSAPEGTTPPAIEAPAPTTPTPDTGAWSRDALARLGVPDVLIRAIEGQRPTDDLGWFAACARAVTPLCGEHDGAAVLVGPNAAKLAKVLEAPIRTVEERAPRRGTVALRGKLTDRTRNWLEREHRDRPLHLVLGGADWRGWLGEQPAIVSWAKAGDLPAALETAARFGVTLGGFVDGGQLHGATPVDVAYALRALLEEAA